ncbi:hypothetical protein SDC9_83417 [bioreactor metagenome]|uniref:Lipoprotein n=1 Tax=bioreactor metagenome TaxID=1076179 RepID=A0A644ZG35_9ZZZZ|nr:hypothetical protein [Christensenella sp.]
MKKILLIALALTFAAILLTGCASADVILKYSPASLDKIIEKYPAVVTDNTQNDHYFYLSADGETALKISSDFSLTGAEDLVIQTPLKPFVDAGLHPAALGAGYRADDTTLSLVADFGAGTGEQDTVTSALFESVKANRLVLTYHADLDHYGIQLPAGKFEWAKDESTNDKDIVFVIAAQPLADLGVDVRNIEGWVFKTMKDDAGKDLDVLLKPYSLES